MNLLNLPGNNLDEIVFATRNKSYGAYALRKSYDTHLLKASALAILFFSLLYLLGWSLHFLNKPIIDPDMVEKETPFKPMTDYIIEVEIPPAPHIPTVSLKQQSREMSIVPDQQLQQPPPTPITQAASSTPEGTGNIAGQTGSGTGTATQANKGIQGNLLLQTEATDNILPTSEVLPSFPGGDMALSKFLSDHIQYPDDAKRMGIEGKVAISFVVEKDGSISGITIVRGRGYGLNEEAERLIGLMPAWTPGLQGGKAVRVKCTLPISFAFE
jgi:protein TonB